MTANHHHPLSITAFIVVGFFALAIPAANGGSPHGHPSISLLGISLGHANLAGVQEKLGRAKVWGDGDAGLAETKVCYMTRGADSVVLVFASNAEMAGPPENDITDIKILPSTPYHERSRCTSLTVSASEVRTDNGLQLGLDHSAVRKILGLPTGTIGSKWDYSWNVDQPLPASDKNYQYWLAKKEECFDGKSPFFTISSGITVKFDGGVVIGLNFYRIESMC